MTTHHSKDAESITLADQHLPNKNTLTYRWLQGQAEVQLMGGKVGPIYFNLSGREPVSPLKTAPWCSDKGPEFDALPALMQNLGGDWCCIPFGFPSPPDDLPSEGYDPQNETQIDQFFHGYAAHHLWHLVEHTTDLLTIACDYPSDSPIKRISRTLYGDPNSAKLSQTLSVEARRDVCLNLALHPTFYLSQQSFLTELQVESFRFGLTYPREAGEGTSLLSKQAFFHSLKEVPGAKGQLVDLTRLPLPDNTEEILQLCEMQGDISLLNHEDSYKVTLSFDKTLFNSVILWISNRGRGTYPWNNRFTALGIEPARSAFDFGSQLSAGLNPIKARGVDTSFELKANKPLITTYSIELSHLS